MAKKQAYVVWAGRSTGVFRTWPEVQRSTSGFKGARQQGFATVAAAEAAWAAGDPDGAPRTVDESAGKAPRSADSESDGRPTGPAICVDAACDTTRWRMEYRGVRLDTGEELFAEGPFLKANANFGEFLGIVDALRRIERETPTRRRSTATRSPPGRGSASGRSTPPSSATAKPVRRSPPASRMPSPG